MLKHDELLTLVRKILFREWDPIGVNHNEECRNEYDSYALTICSRMRDGADEQRLFAHLVRLQQDAMGMSQVNEQLHWRLARRLHRLVPPNHR